MTDTTTAKKKKTTKKTKTLSVDAAAIVEALNALTAALTGSRPLTEMVTNTTAVEGATVDSEPAPEVSTTKEDIVAALQEVSANHDLEAVRSILKEFECDRVSEVPEEKYDTFIAACVNYVPATTTVSDFL